MCRPGFLSNTVCPTISENPSPRPSHFPCWPCIKLSAHTEAVDKRAHAHALATAANNARELVLKDKLESEKRAREERVRREAREKAERERAAEQKMRVEREKEVERARKEGGMWMLAEAGSGKKKKGKGGAGGHPGGLASPGSPGSPSAVVGVGASKKEAWKENVKGAEERGRAGIWGPKQILSRKEGAAGVLLNRTDGANEMNSAKK